MSLNPEPNPNPEGGCAVFILVTRLALLFSSLAAWEHEVAAEIFNIVGRNCCKEQRTLRHCSAVRCNHGRVAVILSMYATMILSDYNNLSGVCIVQYFSTPKRPSALEQCAATMERCSCLGCVVCSWYNDP